MRILAISDIHGNIEAVRRLRWLESNRFDMVIIAGDLGNESAVEILGILTTFSCPLLYVLGNHDYNIPYDDTIFAPAIHIHNGPVIIDDWCIVGYSGCDENWGKNPISFGTKEEFSALAIKYKKTIDTYEDLQDRAAEFFKRTGSQFGAAQAKIDRLEKTVGWRKYIAEYRTLKKSIVDRNVQHTTSLWKQSGISQNNTIFVSHARTYKLQNQLPDLRLHIFGHHHGFKDSTSRRIRFINVSVLDDTPSVHIARESTNRLTIANVSKFPLLTYGTYTVIETKNDGQIEARSIKLRANDFVHSSLSL